MSEDTKKFLFHLHNFGEPEEDDGPPPPPTFSEDELGQAKKEAYEQGKKDGFTDSQASIEKKIAILLENASQRFLDLQSSEASRERQYEEEAVNLSLTLFQSIYPAWLAEKGPADVTQAIEHVLKGAANQQGIEIAIHPDLLDNVQKRFEPLVARLSTTHILFEADESLNEGDMRMSWHNGGAIRDTKTLSEQILQSLKNNLPETIQEEEHLAGSSETRHNTIEETEKTDE